jgi:hypothetical protein
MRLFASHMPGVGMVAGHPGAHPSHVPVSGCATSAVVAASPEASVAAPSRELPLSLPPSSVVGTSNRPPHAHKAHAMTNGSARVLTKRV